MKKTSKTIFKKFFVLSQRSSGRTLLANRMAIFILFISCSIMTIPYSFAQNTNMRIDIKGKTIEEAIKKVEAESGFLFYYNSKQIDTKQIVTKNQLEGNVTSVLNQLFGNTNISYTIKDKDILLTKKETSSPASSVTTTSAVDQQSIVVNGSISDEEGLPIAGATVSVVGAAIGVTTNGDGQYSITVPSASSELKFSYIGYIAKTITVGKQRLINVSLSEDTSSLGEVVVVGYGQQKRESIVGSVQSISTKDLKVPSASLSTSFAGKMAGVIAVQRGGQPGADQASFWIRGISTLNSAATSPLIVLDGVAISANELNGLDPEIIESFTILKDATATALYGTRSANGVMVVTTKSGEDRGKPLINIRVESSLSTPTSRPKMVDATTFMNMYNEALITRGLNDPGKLYSQDKINNTIAGADQYLYPNIDWYDALFKNYAVNENVNVSIRGGAKRVTYFMDASIRHESGMLKDISRNYFSYNNNYSLWRYHFQNNVSVDLGGGAKVGLRLNAQLRNSKGPNQSSGDVFGNIVNANAVDIPITFPQDPNIGHIMWGGDTHIPNPVAELASGYSDLFRSVIMTNLEYDHDLKAVLPGLKLSALISFKNWSDMSINRSAGYNRYRLVGSETNPDGSTKYLTELKGDEVGTTLGSKIETNSDRRLYFQARANYDTQIKDHNFGAMLVYNQDEVVEPGGDFINSLPRRKIGVAGRLTYDFASKYLFEANFGYYGSENFAPNHRFGFFPSVAVGYRVSEESFFKPIKNVVSNLKFRASYGLVGNDQGQGRFLYMSIITLNSGDRGFTTGKDGNKTLSGPKYVRFGNPDLSWEIGKKSNIGIDLQLFNEFNIMLDFFNEDRSNIFVELNKTIPNFIGIGKTDTESAAPQAFGNLGKVNNKGFDLAIDHNKKIGKDWFISTKATFSYAHNTVIEANEPAYSLYPHLSMIGNSVNTPLLYQAERLFIDDAEVARYPRQQLTGISQAGDIKYSNIADINGYYDNIINTNDQLYSGAPTVPEIIYGFGSSIQWKKFDFSFFFQGAARASLVMSGFYPFGERERRNVMQFIADDYWSESNPDIYAKYPRLDVEGKVNNNVASTYWQRDASFLKLKNLEFGYTHKKMRIYLSGTNIFTFSGFKYWDPEQGGGSGLSYPTQRVFNIGLQMNL